MSQSVAALGELVLALAALLGIGAGAVGLFVLRVEYAALVARVLELEKARRTDE